MTKFFYLKEQLLQIIESAGMLSPEIFLTSSFLLLIILDLILYHNQAVKGNNDNHSRVLHVLGIVALCWNMALISDQFTSGNDAFLFDKMLFIDSKAIFFKVIINISGICMLVHILVNKRKMPSEFYPIVLALLMALQLVTMAVNLLIIYLALETISLLSYILTVFNKDKAGSEGGIKYLIFGATASAIMLYGMSLLYGMTGTLSITSPDFSRGLTQVDEIAVLVAVVLTTCGFLFKLSLTPFHVWTPDVYQAAPTPVVAFFAVAPKAAAFLVAMRFYLAVPNDLRVITAGIAMAAITFGNFSALWQNQIKRMLAYSTIAHAGFMAIGLAILSEIGLKSIVFYLVTYLFANFAVFMLVDILAHYFQYPYDIAMKQLKGLGRQNPLLGTFFVLIMISLAGLPPTAGFFAKFNIFSALWQAYQEAPSNQYILLIVFIFGLLNTAVSLFFYLKIPYYLFFKQAEKDLLVQLSVEQYVWVSLLVLPILVLFFKADWLMQWINLL